VSALPEGVEAGEELLEGDTVEALAALDEHEIDLLVCGSRAYGPVRRVLLGGVLRRLIRRAACPVLHLTRRPRSLPARRPIRSRGTRAKPAAIRRAPRLSHVSISR